MLVFNSIESIRVIYSCVSYFVDNGIAGIEESLGLFFFLAFEKMLLSFIRTSKMIGSSDLIRSSAK